jgi:hypothetical protein
VVWGDGRDPANAVWGVPPAGQGSCQSSPLIMRVYPVQSGCTQATSLAIEVTGLVFMQCFTYDVLSSVPIVGPEVLLEPTGFRGELRLTQLQFDIVASVEDCTQVRLGKGCRGGGAVHDGQQVHESKGAARRATESS